MTLRNRSFWEGNFAVRFVALKQDQVAQSEIIKSNLLIFLGRFRELRA